MPSDSEQPVDIEADQGTQANDVIIAFMGPTGSGKSTFIDLLTGESGKRAGHTLKSTTDKVQATRVNRGGVNVVLVDTPGFDDTRGSDLEVLRMIGDWLKITYDREVRLSGLIYLHRITNNRMGGAACNNLKMFGNLCGDLSMSRVIFVSTAWDEISGSNFQRQLCVQREAELKRDFWKDFLEHRSQVDRLERNNSPEAWRIVDRLVKTHQRLENILLQEELGKLKLRLRETHAGKTLQTSLGGLVADCQKNLKELLGRTDRDMPNPQLAQECKEKVDELRKEIQGLLKDAGKLNIPLSRRLRLFFFGKQTQAKAITITVPVDPAQRTRSSSSSPWNPRKLFKSRANKSPPRIHKPEEGDEEGEDFSGQDVDQGMISDETSSLSTNRSLYTAGSQQTATSLYSNLGVDSDHQDGRSSKYSNDGATDRDTDGEFVMERGDPGGNWLEDILNSSKTTTLALKHVTSLGFGDRETRVNRAKSILRADSYVFPGQWAVDIEGQEIWKLNSRKIYQNASLKELLRDLFHDPSITFGFKATPYMPMELVALAATGIWAAIILETDESQPTSAKLEAETCKAMYRRHMANLKIIESSRPSDYQKITTELHAFASEARVQTDPPALEGALDIANWGECDD